MIKSMTGFSSQEVNIDSCGRISVEIRSSNHKFQETVLHLPQGFLALEDKIKKAIESKIKRGRVTCAVNIIGGPAPAVFINKKLLNNYMSAIQEIKNAVGTKSECSMDTLIQLPGVLALLENHPSRLQIWPRLNTVLNKTVDGLMDARKKEGQALYLYLKSRIKTLEQDIKAVQARFKGAVKEKILTMDNDEERSNFIKDADVAEEIQRLSYHIKNFKSKLLKNVPVGKELDFIAQEMQREANTLASKTFDPGISARVVQIKSEIEKLREQVQNIE